MDNQNHCMSIKQARLIVKAHKHNLLNSFCNNGYVCLYIKQHENNNTIQSIKNQERECSYGSNCLVEFVIPWQNDRTGQ